MEMLNDATCNFNSLNFSGCKTLRHAAFPLTARRLVRALPDDRRLRLRRGLLERLFDRRGDRRGDLRRAGMCVLQTRCTKKCVQRTWYTIVRFQLVNTVFEWYSSPLPFVLSHEKKSYWIATSQPVKARFHAAASSGSVMFEVRTLFDTLVYHSATSVNTMMRSGMVICVTHTL